MATYQVVEAQMLAALAKGPQGTAAARTLLLDPPFQSDTAQPMLTFALAAVVCAGERSDLKWLDKVAAQAKKTWPATWSRDWFLEHLGDTQALLGRLLDGASKPVRATDLPVKPHPRWLARAAAHDFSELDALLSELTDGPATQIAERAQTLLGWPKDARIARAGLALHEGRLVSNPRHPIWAAAGNLIAVHSDAAVRRALQSKMVEDPTLAGWHWISKWQGGSDPAVRKAEPRSTGGAPQTPDDWAAWVFAAPADLNRRALWADWLLERGDPRGELLSLQLLERALTPAEHKRVAALVKKHARAWLGKLAGVVDPKTAVFERGVAVEGRANAAPEGRVFADAPQWAALERLTLPDSRVGPKLEAALLACVPRLTWLDCPRPPFLRKVLALPMVRLAGLSVNFGSHAPAIAAGDLGLLTSAQVPALRRLRVSGQPGAPVVKALAALPWFPQLEVLCVDGGALHERLAAVEATPLPRLDVLAPHMHGWDATEPGFSYRATRAPGAKWQLEAMGLPSPAAAAPPAFLYEHHLLPSLIKLPAGRFSEVTLVVPKAFQPVPKKVTAQIARLVR